MSFATSRLLLFGTARRVYSTQYQAILTRAASSGFVASSTTRTNENLLMQTLVSSGLYAKMIGGKVFKTDGDINFACIDWKNPSNSGKDAIPVSSPTFVKNRGLNGNGTTSYTRSGISTADFAQTNYTICSRGLIGRGAGNGVNTSALFGAGNGTGTNFGSSLGGIIVNPHNASDQVQYRASSSGTSGTSNSTDATNRIAIKRSGTTESLSLNGSVFSTSALTDAVVSPDLEIYLSGVNGTSLGGLNTRGISYFFVFTALSDAEIAIFDAAIALYLQINRYVETSSQVVADGASLANTGLDHDSVHDEIVVSQWNGAGSSNLLHYYDRATLTLTASSADVGMDSIQDVAYDQTNNVYYVAGSAGLRKIQRDGTVLQTISSNADITGSSSHDWYNGFLWFTDGSNIYKVETTGFTTVQTIAIAPIGTFDEGLHVDAAGYMIGEASGLYLRKYNWSGLLINEITTSVSQGEGLTVDNSGNVYQNKDTNLHGGVVNGNKVYVYTKQ